MNARCIRVPARVHRSRTMTAVNVALELLERLATLASRALVWACAAATRARFWLHGNRIVRGAERGRLVTLFVPRPQQLCACDLLDPSTGEVVRTLTRGSQRADVRDALRVRDGVNAMFIDVAPLLRPGAAAAGAAQLSAAHRFIGDRCSGFYRPPAASVHELVELMEAWVGAPRGSFEDELVFTLNDFSTARLGGSEVLDLIDPREH